MPQLNPTPWFAILMFTWLIFLLVIPSKIMKHAFTNDPAVFNTEKSKNDAWNWPWH